MSNSIIPEDASDGTDSNPNPSFDTHDHAIRWMNVVYRDCPPEGRIVVSRFEDIPGSTKRGSDHKPFTKDQIVQIAATYANGIEEEVGTYARLSVVHHNIIVGTNGRGKKEATLGVNVLWAEFDPSEGEQDIPAFKARVLERLRNADLPPTMTDDSGRGIHAIWAIEFTTDVNRVERSNLWLLQRFSGSDKVTYNHDRLFRLPGTFNPRPAARSIPHLIDEDYHPERIYKLDQFGQVHLATTSSGEFKIPRIVSTLSDEVVIDRIKASHSRVRFEAYMAGDGSLRKDGGHDQSSADMELLYIIADHTCDIEQVDSIFSASGFAEQGSWLTEDGYRRFTLAKVAVKKESDWLLLYQRRRAATSDEKFRVRSFEEVMNEPPPRFIIDNYLRERSVGMIFGQSGIGKSLFALDLAMHVALGLDWHGNKLRKPGYVLYFVAEGREELPERGKAWLKSHGYPVDMKVPHLKLITETASLQDGGDAATFLQRVAEQPEPPVLILLDTLALTMVGGNENDSQDMMAVMSAMMKARDAYDSTVLAIHHPRKDGLTERGSGTFRNACQTILQVLKDTDTSFTVHPDKQRGGRPQQPLTFAVEGIDLPEITIQYDDGETWVPTGGYIRPMLFTERANAMMKEGMKKEFGKDQKIIDALEKAGPDGLSDLELMAAIGVMNTSSTYRTNREAAVDRGMIFKVKGKQRALRFFHKDYAPDDAETGD